MSTPPEAIPNPAVSDEELLRWTAARTDTNPLFNGNILGAEIPPEPEESAVTVSVAADSTAPHDTAWLNAASWSLNEDRGCLCVSPMPGQHQIRLTLESAPIMIERIQSWVKRFTERANAPEQTPGT